MPFVTSTVHPAACSVPPAAMRTDPTIGLVMARVQNCAPDMYRFASWKVVVTPSPVPMN